MTKQIDEALLAGLTDEEREGMLDTDLVDDEDDLAEGQDGEIILPGKANAAAAETDGEEGDDDNDDDTAAADAAAVVAAAAATPAATDAAVATDEIQLDERQAIWLTLDDMQSKSAAYDQKLSELTLKFDDGDLTAGEYHEQRAKIEAERKPVDRDIMRAEMRKEDDIERWKGEVVPDFLKNNPAYAQGGILNTMLDAEVRKIQSTAKNPTDPKILDLAAQRINAQLKLATGSTPPTPKPTPTPPKKVERLVVPTLGGVPAADANDATDGGEFAHLDRLAVKSSVEYEAALSKLSPAQLDAYLSK